MIFVCDNDLNNLLEVGRHVLLGYIPYDPLKRTCNSFFFSSLFTNNVNCSKSDNKGRSNHSDCNSGLLTAAHTAGRRFIWFLTDLMAVEVMEEKQLEVKRRGRGVAVSYRNRVVDRHC
ncbi:hypothetical protein L1987_79705 [Smallanthus sonchifolius]|uniref:Uncharacterized protein n=1 Tax=Smallanthus sonchifolius TaxID=185202 RepID=A0ACB8YLP6_9ASTR|nr:hypothetical protein L1987_79705 [Smallanthus sonchifolius]